MQPGRGPLRIAVIDGGGSESAAERLATELNLPATHSADATFDLLLVVRADRLELCETGPGAPGPVYADFAGQSPTIGKGGRRQPIARAVGLADGKPSVVDATAGLGRDAFLLASLGCRVTAIERSQVVAALLRDGLRRASAVPVLEEIVSDRLQLITGDARDVLTGMQGNDAPDVVYLDPMFPINRKASALVKKEMRLFRKLVGDDGDAGELLNVARKTARHRVVVKRMLRAPPLGSEPSITYKGKITRYDVYLTHRPL